MDMTMESCRDFADALASAAPTPGGGGAAALAGALGVALGNMVCALTVGKKKYAAVEEEILALQEKGNLLRAQLLDQVEADEMGFLPLAKAYSIPKEDPSRARILEEATEAACEVPMKIMELCGEAIDCIAEIAEKGSRMVLSDAGCGIILCKAAMQAAALNVLCNTKTMADREKADRRNVQVHALLENYTAMADSVYGKILSDLV